MINDEKSKLLKSDGDVRAESISGALARFCAFLSTLAVMFFCLEVRWFSLHPIFMTFSFTFLISEGVLTAREFKLKPLERKDLASNHMWVQLMNFLFGGLGFIVILTNKLYYGKRHFRTWHSILGLVVIIALVVEVIVGLYLYTRSLRTILSKILPCCFPTPKPMKIDDDGKTKVTPLVTSKWTRRIHRWMGMIVLYLGTVVMILGLTTNYMTLQTPTIWRNAIIVLVVLMTIFVWWAMRGSRKKSNTLLPTSLSGRQQPILNVLPTTVTPKQNED